MKRRVDTGPHALLVRSLSSKVSTPAVGGRFEGWIDISSRTRWHWRCCWLA